MRPTSHIYSHLVAVCIGIAIAAAGGEIFRQPTASVASAPARRTGNRSTQAKAPREPGKIARPIKETLSSKDYQKAWDELVHRHLSRDERVPIQRKLLEAWAQVDLRSALDAAMREAWGGGSQFLGTSAFSQVFADRPLDAWALIQSGRYGVGTQKLRDEWVRSVIKDNRMLVASMLSEFPGRMGVRVIEDLLRGISSEQERAAITGKIIAQAGDSHDDWLRQVFKELPADRNPGALRDTWNALPPGAERRIELHRWGASVRSLNGDQLAAELALVPAEARGEAAAVVLSQIGESAGLLAALEFAMASDQWETMAKSAAPQLEHFAATNHMEPWKLVEWATHLPERPDTVEIYQKAIGRYIREDLPRAKAWLEGMPEGSWQRDHGLAEFSQQALSQKQDFGASGWALETIRDPEVKAEANGGTR